MGRVVASEQFPGDTARRDRQRNEKRVGERGAEPSPSLLRGLLLVLAAGLLLASTALTYALTKEYGYSPNDDLVHDLSQAATGHVLVALLIAALAAGGLVLATRLGRRVLVLSVIGVFVAAFVVLGLSKVVGQQALDARCADSRQHSSGAC